MARAHKRKKQGGPQEFDASRWTHAVFAIFAGIAAWMFSHAVEDSWALAWAQWPAQIPRPNEYWAQGVGIALGLAIIIWIWSRERYFKWITEVVVDYRPRVGTSKVTGTIRGTVGAIGDMGRLLMPDQPAAHRGPADGSSPSE